MSYLEYSVKSVPTGFRKILFLNWPLALLLASVCGIGFLMLYSVAGGSFTPWAEPQMKRFALGLALMITVALIPIWLWRNLSGLAYGTSLVLLIAVGLGFRSPAGVGSWLAALGLLAALVLALTWVAILAGLGAKTVESASAFSYPILFLPFVSSAFVPTDTMPGPLRWFAEHQPVTALVDALRQLWAGEGAGSDLWVSLAWCAGILVVAQTWAVVRYRRRLH